jgi:threonine/homoserine efflux transporter RhtA
VVVAALTAFVAVAATAIAFSLSQASLRHITPTEFAVTSTLEPALAAVAAAIFLGVTLRPPQYAGSGRAPGCWTSAPDPAWWPGPPRRGAPG